MKHTIEKVNERHWIINDTINIKYNENFSNGVVGWYIENGNEGFLNTEKVFLTVLNQAIKKSELNIKGENNGKSGETKKSDSVN
jgi:hypothetical protein